MLLLLQFLLLLQQQRFDGSVCLMLLQRLHRVEGNLLLFLCCMRMVCVVVVLVFGYRPIRFGIAGIFHGTVENDALLLDGNRGEMLELGRSRFVVHLPGEKNERAG